MLKRTVNILNKIFKYILIKISRIIFWITPEEFKKNIQPSAIGQMLEDENKRRGYLKLLEKLCTKKFITLISQVILENINHRSKALENDKNEE